MATPRHLLVDPNNPMYYHLVSRCVRQSYLCGIDRRTGQNFNHRRGWILQKLRKLCRLFTVELAAYSIMSNHFHLVLRYDPQANKEWSDEEVVDRWLQVVPPNDGHGRILFDRIPERRLQMLEEPAAINHAREQLGSLSTFMKFLKQPIATAANREDQCSGHFFEERFYSGALLTAEAVVASMAYVDLNPIRAKIADTLEQSDFTSIQERIHINHPDSLQAAIAPLVSGLEETRRDLPITLKTYLNILRAQIQATQVDPTSQSMAAKIASVGKYQRAHGNEPALKHWLGERQMRNLEKALPT